MSSLWPSSLPPSCCPFDLSALHSLASVEEERTFSLDSSRADLATINDKIYRKRDKCMENSLVVESKVHGTI